MLLLHRSACRQDRLGPALCRLLGISELNGGRTWLCLAGVCFLGAGALQHACIPLRDSNTELGLPDIVERIANNGRHLEVALLRAWRHYAGSPADLLELNRFVLDQQPEAGEEFDAGAENRIEGRVVIHPTAEVTSSVVLGPSIIGPGATVTNSYIGPYTSIGAGAQIEGAEIERSIILDGARIMHVSGRIEASTVGARANIFRDFKIPRALRLHVGEGVEVALN
jgi:glucose-1-phosphate thymidylyltransferase